MEQLSCVKFPEIREDQICSDVGCHEWSNGCRFLGLRSDDVRQIADDIPTYRLLKEHWKKLLIPASGKFAKKPRLRRIEAFPDGTFFTQTLKEGHEMDTGRHEFPVKILKKLNEASFTTPVDGYYGFFRYSIEEVEAIAPAEANAFTLDDCGRHSDAFQRGNVTFYRVEIDASQRLMTSDELEDNFDLAVALRTGEEEPEP